MPRRKAKPGKAKAGKARPDSGHKPRARKNLPNLAEAVYDPFAEAYDMAQSSTAEMAPGRMLHLIKEVQYAAYVRLEQALQPLGVTTVQFRILSTLSHQERLSSAELGRIYNVKPQTMIKQIVLLESKKLIRRRAGPHNKRVLEVELTPRGREVLETCNTEGARLEDELLSPFSGGQQAIYRELLSKLLDTLDKLDESLPPAPAARDHLDPEGTRPGVQRGAAKKASKP